MVKAMQDSANNGDVLYNTRSVLPPSAQVYTLPSSVREPGCSFAPVVKAAEDKLLTVLGDLEVKPFEGEKKCRGTLLKLSYVL